MRPHKIIYTIKFTLLILLLLPLNISYASREKTKVRVGIYQNNPLVGQNINGVPEGLFVDILREIASQEGWEPVFVLDTFSNNLKRSRDGELDLIAAVARTDDRERFLDFSKEIVCTLWGTVYVQPNSHIQTILDLDGKRIAIMNKGIFGKKFKQLCRDFNIKCTFVEVPSQTASLKLLKEKKVD